MIYYKNKGGIILSILFNYWILPLIFIFHDLEEIIMVPIWKKRNSTFISKLKHPFFGNTNNGSAFSICVLEEFIILIIISLFCFLNKNIYLYLSFLIGYGLHSFMHFKMCFQFKGYVPGIITILLELPLIIYLVIHYAKLCKNSFILLTYICISIIIIYMNLYIMHRLMHNIELKINNYEK